MKAQHDWWIATKLMAKTCHLLIKVNANCTQWVPQICRTPKLHQTQ